MVRGLTALLLLLSLATAGWGAEDYKALYRKGVEQSKKKNFDEAIRLYSQAIAMKPKAAKDLATLHYVRARAYAEKDRYQDALADINSAIQLKPDFAEALNYRGMMLGVDRKQKEAAADFKKACDLGFQPACENLNKQKK